jgi:mRNA interferase RelE/StbE
VIRKADFDPAAWRDLKRLDRQNQDRILSAIRRLVGSQQGDVKKLQGRDGEYRLRVGRWRVFFYVEKSENMIVFRIDNRGEAY